MRISSSKYTSMPTFTMTSYSICNAVHDFKCMLLNRVLKALFQNSGSPIFVQQLPLYPTEQVSISTHCRLGLLRRDRNVVLSYVGFAIDVSNGMQRTDFLLHNSGDQILQQLCLHCLIFTTTYTYDRLAMQMRLFAVMLTL